jgi:predicted O-methyltransferase YrrM
LLVDWNPPSGWIGHEDFLSWLIQERKPHTFVELGVHFGYSYFVACQTIKEHGFKTNCYGVDTWQGDDHAGHYGPEVYEAVSTWNERFPFSKLIRATFDEAVEQFRPTSIDLLHIDGRHDYEDVKHDFETWEGKLFPGATVLFHDIAVEGFGVRQFWNEVRQKHPHFEFDHAHGLGVLTYR